jgi:hypothetical protein
MLSAFNGVSFILEKKGIHSNRFPSRARIERLRVTRRQSRMSTFVLIAERLEIGL